MTQVSVDLDDVAVRRMLKTAPDKLLSGVRRLIQAAAINVQGVMRKEAPVGVKGALRRGVTYTTALDGLQATVRPVAKYADDIEEGRGPHYVSVKDESSPLRKWAEFKGLNPWAVQKSIAKKGTKANPFVDRTFRATETAQGDFLARGVERLMREVQQ